MSVEILREADRLLAAGERVALATIVATRGSTPQKASARMLVDPSGRAWGTLGGGAVEAEAVREAKACLAGGGALVVREYQLSNAVDEWGLACGGTLAVLIEPLTHAARSWLAEVLRAVEGDPLGLVTMLDGPRAGERLLVREGQIQGTLGDRSIDEEAARLAHRALARDGAETDDVGGCRAYAEAFAPAPALYILGAGHVGRALAALGPLLGLAVTVVDDRAEFATRARFPEADRVLVGAVGPTLSGLPVTARSAIVVAMRDQDLDYEAVKAALATPARYVGLVGARRKALLITERLVAAGVPAERVRQLRSPIGLDLGARTPAEIAVSILGEWLMLRLGGSGAPLRVDEAALDEAVQRGRSPVSDAARRRPEASGSSGGGRTA